MKFKALLFAALAAVLSFSSCEELGGLVEQGGLPSIEFVDFEEEEILFGAEGGDRQISFLANRNWTIEEDASWIEVSPKEGEPSDKAQTVMIKVVKNELDEDEPAAGFDREAEVRFTVGAKSLYLTVKQNGPQGSTEALVVYYNNFDKEKAEKTDDKWQTYLDSYEGWKNATGTGVETVTYEFTSMTARTNSGNGSAGSYSDYKDKGASGMNYLWMGSGKPYFAVKNITLPAGKVNYTISFGTERYLYEATDNTFNWEEFKAFVSIDGTKWSVLACEFAAGKLPNGRWDLASATIKVPAGTEKLHLYFASDLGSAYALDDIKVEEALSEGVAIDFSAGVVIDPNQGEAGGESDATAIYSNNFDKQAAAQGSNGWPYLDQTDVWMNAAGTGAADVTYASSGVSVRNNSNSDGNYSDYAGSGMNNIFFGKTPYFAINNIALGGATDLTLTFGTEKYSQTAGSVFTNSEYHIWLSADGGAKWVEFTDYTFAGGTTSGRWNVATANFTVPSGTETLSICMQVDVASAYRLDDMKLVASQTAGTTVDFTGAVAKDFSTGGGSVTPPAGEITDVTVAQFNEKPVSTTVLYRLTGTVGGPINTTYGNFDLIDETGKVYVYGISNWSEYSASFAEGGTVTVVGQRGDYNGKIEVLEAYIERYTAGGETPTPPAGDGSASTIAQVLALGANATIPTGTTVEGIVISNMALNNLTSKKGLYIQDATAGLQFYLAANHEFAFGDKVKVDLGGATVGEYNGAVQISGLALDKITKVSSGNTVTPKTVTITDFLANKYEGQYVAIEGVQVASADLSKTFVVGGAHTSINMETADGKKFVIFSSKYASYGTTNVPQGSGTIKGISSISKGAIQIIFAQESDFAGLTGERFGQGAVEPEPEPDQPETPVAANRADFETFPEKYGQYTKEFTSTAGWHTVNCAIQEGGASDANPVFVCIGKVPGTDTWARAVCINGKVGASGVLTSPEIAGGCGTLSFTMANVFSEKNGISFQIDVIQNSEVVKTLTVTKGATEVTQKVPIEHSVDVNVSGSFSLKFTNLSPSNSTSSNKDRVSIWNLTWTAFAN